MAENFDSIYGDIPLCDEIYFQTRNKENKNQNKTIDEPEIDCDLSINMTPEMRKIKFLQYKKKLKIEIIENSIININNEDDEKTINKENSNEINSQTDCPVVNPQLDNRKSLENDNKEKETETICNISDKSDELAEKHSENDFKDEICSPDNVNFEKPKSNQEWLIQMENELDYNLFNQNGTNVTLPLDRYFDEDDVYSQPLESIIESWGSWQNKENSVNSHQNNLTFNNSDSIVDRKENDLNNFEILSEIFQIETPNCNMPELDVTSPNENKTELELDIFNLCFKNKETQNECNLSETKILPECSQSEIQNCTIVDAKFSDSEQSIIENQVNVDIILESQILTESPSESSKIAKNLLIDDTNTIDTFNLNDEIKVNLNLNSAQSLCNTVVSLIPKPEPTKRKSLISQKRLQIDSQSESILEDSHQNDNKDDIHLNNLCNNNHSPMDSPNSATRKRLSIQRQQPIDSRRKSTLGFSIQNDIKNEIPLNLGHLSNDIHLSVVKPHPATRGRLSIQSKLQIDSRCESIFGVFEEFNENNIEQRGSSLDATSIKLTISGKERIQSIEDENESLNDKSTKPIAYDSNGKDDTDSFSPRSDFVDMKSSIRKSISSNNLEYLIRTTSEDQNDFKTNTLKKPKPLPRNKVMCEKSENLICPPVPPRPFNSTFVAGTHLKQPPTPAPRTKRFGSLNDIRFGIDLSGNVTSDNVTSSDDGSVTKAKAKSGKLKKCKKMFGKLKDKIKVNLKLDPSEKSQTKFYQD